MTRVLVTGARGLLGTAIAREFAGMEVSALGHGDLDITEAEAVRRTVREIQPALIVNCAAHKTDPVWEDHLRATAAHSTLVVDDRNAFEIGKGGHFGRKATRMESRRDLVAHGLMFTAAHDGYVPLNGLVHTRRLTLSTDGTMFEGEDILSCDAPLVKPAPYAIRFHLHPRVQASVIQDGQAVLLRLGSGAGWRFYKEGAELSLEPSIYCGADGAPRKTMQIVLSGQTDGGGSSVRWQFSEER